MSNGSNATGGPGLQSAQISMRAIWRPHLLVFLATILLSILPLRGLIVSGIFLWWNSTYRSVDLVMDAAEPNSGSPYIAGHIEGSSEQTNVLGSLKDGVMVVKAVPTETFAVGKRLPVWHSDTAPTLTVFGREVSDVPVASLPSRPGVLSFLINLGWFVATWILGLRATAWVAARWSGSYRQVVALGSPTLLVLVLVVAVSAVPAAQTSVPATPLAPTAFEVASIRRNTSTETSWQYGEHPGGRWTMVNRSIASLIHLAYPTVEVDELLGAPGWVASDRYDIAAKADGNPSREQIPKLLQRLLADRFAFASHAEMRDGPVFALVIAQDDGKPKPALAPFPVDCAAYRESNRLGRTWEGPMPSNRAPLCGWRGNGAAYWFGGVPMSTLAEVLRFPSERVVIDRTGLPGNYQFMLSLTSAPDATHPTNPRDDGVSVFTALQEQLGLKLVSDRAPLRALAIDHIERPTED